MRPVKCLVVLVLVGATMTAGEPATAAVRRSGPFRYVTTSSLVRAGSVSPIVEVACPTGTAPVAGGGGFSSRSIGGRIARFEPNLTANWVDIQGVNAGASDLNFSSVAICLDTSVATPALSGASASGSSTTASGGGAGCGGSQTIIGGTGGTVGNLGVTTVELGPTTSLIWSTFFRSTGATGVFQVKAICVNGAILSSTVRERSASIRAGRTAALRVGCPRGSRVTAGGVDSDPSSIVASVPADTRSDRDKTPDDAWLGIAHNTATSDGTFTVTAICVRPT